ncbi:unnamed protein product [Psylliodes chrysocephalus]|uniref:Uncharacterized protein n=1 Tax=Psylliodes chrysocephalus TaxID=3402493 RepID=A0A9P0CRQ4_9CUCU|nr:unnamed protein product [Psylliodes chrysocephala]
MVNIGNLLRETSELKTKDLTRRDMEVVNIRGLQESSTKKGVQDAVEKAVGNWDENCRISEIRSVRNNTAAATVTLDPEAAKKLIADGYIRVGLVKCVVEKWHRIERCFKCWSHDYETRNCQGPDRSENCFKC